MNEDICASIVKLASLVPNGMVVFFTSSVVMEMLMRVMYASKWMDKLTQLKNFFKEPKGNDALFQLVLNDYKKSAYTNKGAIMFAVCRSKVSEGIDLTDQLCRAVVFVGVPYPPIKDIKIMEKKKYQNQKKALFAKDQTKQFKPING